jgi:hypothetical protein
VESAGPDGDRTDGCRLACGSCLMTTRSAFMQAGGLDEGVLPLFRGCRLLQADGQR